MSGTSRQAPGDGSPEQRYALALSLVTELAGRGGLGDEQREAKLLADHRHLVDEIRRAMEAVRTATLARLDAEIDEYSGGFFTKLRKLRDSGFPVESSDPFVAKARRSFSLPPPTPSRQAPKGNDEGDDRHEDLRMTLLETPADLRQTVVLGEKEPPFTPDYRTNTSAIAAQPYRPKQRPPQAVLMIMDDEQATGETVRLRSDRVTIGRAHADITVPHDAGIGEPHVEILREKVDGRYRWLLRDLGTQHGTWVLTQRVRLKSGDEFMIGTHRFRCLNSAAGEESGRASGRVEKLMWFDDRRQERSCELQFPEYWIGRNELVCVPFVLNDLLADAKHALLQRERDGRWLLKDAKTINGTWVRIQEVALLHGCSFQLGEQRFRLFFW